MRSRAPAVCVCVIYSKGGRNASWEAMGPSRFQDQVKQRSSQPGRAKPVTKRCCSQHGSWPASVRRPEPDPSHARQWISDGT